MQWEILKPWLAQAARDGLRTVGTALMSYGVIKDGAGLNAFVGAGMTLAGLVWGWWTTGGAQQMAALLKKLTATATHADAVKAAEVLPPKAAVSSPANAATVASVVAKMLIAAFMLSTFLNVCSATAASAKKQITKAQATANPLTVLQTFTADDLNAALADAKSNNDIAAVNCYTALLPIVQSGIANPLPTGLGGFQLLQKARDAKTLLANLQSPNGPLATLNIACAPLIVDAQNTMIQLGILGGGVLAVGASGGVALPGLSSLLPALGGL